MSNLTDLPRWTVLRNVAIVAIAVPAMLCAGCARQEVAPPPAPAVSEAPPPPPMPAPPPPPPAPVGERG